MEWAFGSWLPRHWHAGPQKIFPLHVLTLACFTKAGTVLLKCPHVPLFGLCYGAAFIHANWLSQKRKQTQRCSVQSAPNTLQSIREAQIWAGCSTTKPSSLYQAPQHQQAGPWHVTSSCDTMAFFLCHTMSQVAFVFSRSAADLPSLRSL